MRFFIHVVRKLSLFFECRWVLASSTKWLYITRSLAFDFQFATAYFLMSSLYAVLVSRKIIRPHTSIETIRLCVYLIPFFKVWYFECRKNRRQKYSSNKHIPQHLFKMKNTRPVDSFWFA